MILVLVNSMNVTKFFINYVLNTMKNVRSIETQHTTMSKYKEIELKNGIKIKEEMSYKVIFLRLKHS